MSSSLSPAGPRGEPGTVRIAMWSARHRWLVVGLWFFAAIGLFVASLSMGGIDAGDPNGNPNDDLRRVHTNRRRVLTPSRPDRPRS